MIIPRLELPPEVVKAGNQATSLAPAGGGGGAAAAGAAAANMDSGGGLRRSQVIIIYTVIPISIVLLVVLILCCRKRRAVRHSPLPTRPMARRRPTGITTRALNINLGNTWYRELDRYEAQGAHQQRTTESGVEHLSAPPPAYAKDQGPPPYVPSSSSRTGDDRNV